jgi:hypothetical protein
MTNTRRPFEDPNGQLDVTKLVDLYKYYESAGSQARAQMITTANWLLTFAIALLVYAVRETLTLGAGWTACAKSYEQAVVVAIVGIALCIVTAATVKEFEAHMQRNWFRATRCKYLVSDLYLLVAEAGRTAPVWEQQKGWPTENPNLREYDKFQAESDLSSRAAYIFVLYRTLVAGLVVGFAAIFVLAFVLSACVRAP